MVKTFRILFFSFLLFSISTNYGNAEKFKQFTTLFYNFSTTTTARGSTFWSFFDALGESAAAGLDGYISGETGTMTLEAIKFKENSNGIINIGGEYGIQKGRYSIKLNGSFQNINRKLTFVTPDESIHRIDNYTTTGYYTGKVKERYYVFNFSILGQIDLIHIKRYSLGIFAGGGISIFDGSSNIDSQHDYVDKTINSSYATMAQKKLKLFPTVTVGISNEIKIKENLSLGLDIYTTYLIGESSFPYNEYSSGYPFELYKLQLDNLGGGFIKVKYFF